MRKFLSLTLMAVCAALLVQPAFAADAPDMSSPKSTAIAFAKALQANDTDTLKAVCVGSDDEQKAVQTLGSAMSAMRRFKTACADKFGKDNALGGGIPDMNLVAEAEKAEFKVDGDTAKSVAKEGEPQKDQAVLKKIDGKWKVDLKSMGAELMTQAKQMEKFQKLFNDCAAEIESGKYKTVEEAAVAIQPRMLEATK
jgi:hypothetical protein